jgi:hypothetical protein
MNSTPSRLHSFPLTLTAPLTLSLFSMMSAHSQPKLSYTLRCERTPGHRDGLIGPRTREFTANISKPTSAPTSWTHMALKYMDREAEVSDKV